MRKLIFILLLAMCDKPDSTIYEPTKELYCVDCWDILTHVAFIDCFCGESDEADRFIIDAKEKANQCGMILYCNKHF